MNPYGVSSPESYAEAFNWAIGFMMVSILSAALLIWFWKRKGAARNHAAYAGAALALFCLTPFEQLIGSRLPDEMVYRFSIWVHRGRMVGGGLAAILSAAGLVRMYVVARRRPVGGQIAGVSGVVLGGLVGLFAYTQQMWRVEARPVLKELPTLPALRGGYVVTHPKWNIGFISPSREWTKEPEAVRNKEAIEELAQRNLRGRARIFTEPGVTAPEILRDHCLANIKQLYPGVVIEKEEKKTIYQFQAIRIVARTSTDLGEQRFFCTVYAGAEDGYRVQSWCGAANYAQLLPDFETMHDSFQMLQQKKR